MPIGIYIRTEKHREALRKRPLRVGEKSSNWKGGKPKCLVCNKIITYGYKYCHYHGVPKDEKHADWKGDYVGYRALHDWIERKLGKPQKCEFCESTIAKRYHWANLNHKYNRKFTDWVRLCVSCHRYYDLYFREVGYQN